MSLASLLLLPLFLPLLLPSLFPSLFFSFFMPFYLCFFPSSFQSSTFVPPSLSLSLLVFLPVFQEDEKATLLFFSWIRQLERIAMATAAQSNWLHVPIRSRRLVVNAGQQKVIRQTESLAHHCNLHFQKVKKDSTQWDSVLLRYFERILVVVYNSQ